MPIRRQSLLALLSGVLVATLDLHAGGTGAGILTGRYTIAQVREHLRSNSDWHPFPITADRDAWKALPADVRSAYVREAEKHLHTGWSVLTAADFLDYTRTGNRSRYQDLSFGRRQLLATFVIAECVEGKGRFRDDVINGIWAICEETYWGVPAHVGAQKRGSGLPDVTEPTVEKTFGADRYSLWTMQSAYHNLPTINGRGQEAGRMFAARDVAYHALDSAALLSMDIAGAYPEPAGIRAWRREVSLNRGRDVVVRDQYDLARAEENGIRLSLMTCREPDLGHPGSVLLRAAASSAKLEYDASLFAATSEAVTMTDPQLQSCWGGRLWRILLTIKTPPQKQDFEIRIRKE